MDLMASGEGRAAGVAVVAGADGSAGRGELVMLASEAYCTMKLAAKLVVRASSSWFG